MRILSLALLAGAATFGSAQTGYIYVTDGDGGFGYTHILHGGGEIGSYQWAGSGEVPIVVTGSGANQAQYAGQGAIGHQYVGGIAVGTNNWNNGGINAYDAATNGSSIFTVDWTSGVVKAWGMNYDGAGTALFTAAAYDLGITYDSRSGTLFTSNWGDGQIREWSMSGSLLATWNYGAVESGALAYDSTDDTLWFKDNGGNRMDQIDPNTGAYLGGYSYTPYVLGGEAQAVPEPMTLAALGMGCLVALKRRKKA